MRLHYLCVNRCQSVNHMRFLCLNTKSPLNLDFVVGSHVLCLWLRYSELDCKHTVDECCIFITVNAPNAPIAFGGTTWALLSSMTPQVFRRESAGWCMASFLDTLVYREKTWVP